MEGYTFVITEKPDAAYRIANALDDKGKAERLVEKGIPYFIAYRKEKIVVVPTLGHLYTVTQSGKEQGSRYPVFNIKWAPLYQVKRKADRSRIWLQVISNLAREANRFIDACDYDLEGSIIGYCILKYACGEKQSVAKRMKYSTLTKEELQRAYDSLLPNLNFALIESGLTRHEVDWLYGVNLSRALTLATKRIGGYYATLSTGRVQGPTLKFLVERERDIAGFVPTPYWTIKAQITKEEKQFEATYKRNPVKTKEEAEKIAETCRGKKGIVESVEEKKLILPPPVPFDLGELQSEAYSSFGYLPILTSTTTQQLYLEALISYPRTGSQKLPPQIGYEDILKKLSAWHEYNRLARELLAEPKLKPNEGKKSDPAHPAIYPTGKLPEKALVGAGKNIFDLVVRRFFAVFGSPAIRQIIRVTINIDGESFTLTGKKTVEEGWLRFYNPYRKLEDVPLPLFQKGQEVEVEGLILENKVTQPPPRYSPKTLLQKMEEHNIGTKATRAGIIQTLYDRGYIRDEKVMVSELGVAVIDTLEKFCPSVVSVEFTRQLEEQMEAIRQGKETKERIIARTIENLKEVTTNLKVNEKAVGEQLSRALQMAKIRQKTIGSCPICHSGKLSIIQSKKTNKRFAGCTNYFKGTCKAAFPLPQRGIIEPSERVCYSCKWPTVQVSLRGKKRWILCLNPACLNKIQKIKEAGVK
ncbi:MAG: DNA topoisomerase I [Candidatus Bathyarchaeota archaeon]|nr:DNA topoisomerase I [Candidatus Bathyarchaeota archaeon]